MTRFCMHPSRLVGGELGMPFSGHLFIALIPLAFIPSAYVASVLLARFPGLAACEN